MVPWFPEFSQPWRKHWPVDPRPKKEPYSYFDTPDHADCFQKMWFATKHGVHAALAWSFFDIVVFTRPLPYINVAGRVMKNLGGIGGSFVLGSAMSCAVANWRGQKDDEINYMIGFGFTGLIWGYRYRSTGIGAGACFALACLGFLTKRAQIQGWQILYPADQENIRVQNGALGGARYSDLRVFSRSIEPGIGNRSAD